MVDIPSSAADAPSVIDFVTKFDATYKAFYDNYNALMALGPYVQQQHPEMLAQYNDMLQRGSEHAYTLENIKSTRDTAVAWLQWLQQGAVGTFNWIARQVGLGDSGLGIAPVVIAVGIAAAIAALAAVTKWLTDAYVFAQRLNAMQAIDRAHPDWSVAQRTAYVNGVLGPPASSDFLGIPWSLLIWGGMAIFLGPPLIRMLTSSRE